MSSNFTVDRELGMRYFQKEGGLYVTEPTDKRDEDGNVIYEDVLMSSDRMDAMGALTVQEYREVDSVVTEEAKNENRICTWMRGLGGGVVKRFDGMKTKMFWYNKRTGMTVSRATMDLEDDAPAVSVAMEEDGVPLPFEFGDWLWNIRRDGVGSRSAGYDTVGEKARLTAEGVAEGLDLRQVNGWDGLTYRGHTVYGFRDVPTNSTVAQAGALGSGGWLEDSTTPAMIYDNVVDMVKVMTANKVQGPYVLILPDYLRFRFAEPYFVNKLTDKETSLWMKILEAPGNGVPNVLGISQIKLVPEMDEVIGGGAPTTGEAYLLSLNKKWFNVLDYLPAQDFTMSLKGNISTKHRVAEGICPLFRTDFGGRTYGIVKLVAPNGANGGTGGTGGAGGTAAP